MYTGELESQFLNFIALHSNTLNSFLHLILQITERKVGRLKRIVKLTVAAIHEILYLIYTSLIVYLNE